MFEIKSKTNKPFWLQEPSRTFERMLVVFFLATTFSFGTLFLYFSLIEARQQFLETLGIVAVLIAAIVAHVKFVRPYFWKWPVVLSFREFRQRLAKKWKGGKTLVDRHPKLVESCAVNRYLRQAYRIIWTVFISIIYLKLYAIHGAQLNWVIGIYLVAGFGVTIGYHRLPHKAFSTSPLLTKIFYGMGAMANEGIIAEWLRKHLLHHAFAETSIDVHSPIPMENTRRFVALNWLITFVHSFAWWAVNEPSLRRRSNQTVAEWKNALLSNGPTADNFTWCKESAATWQPSEVNGQIITTQTKLTKAWSRYVEQLVEIDADKTMMRMSNSVLYFGIFLTGNFLIPHFIGGVSYLASFATVLLLNWSTFAVNSVSHLWGERPFATADSACNNAYVEILALGEGGHNTHHFRAGWPVHGVFAWQFDPTGELILLMEKAGLVKINAHVSRAIIIKHWLVWRKSQQNNNA